jgi:signal peptidase II
MLKNKTVYLILVAGIVVLADQVTKAVILENLPLYHSLTVIPGLFDITHIHNPGGAFGFLADSGPAVRKLVFFFVSLMALVLIFWFYIKTPLTHRFLATGFAMIFGGAVGNLIDRIRFGKVVDFLDFYVGRYHWPAFNVADSAISIGIGIFLLHLVLKKMPE